MKAPRHKVNSDTQLVKGADSSGSKPKFLAEGGKPVFFPRLRPAASKAAEDLSGATGGEWLAANNTGAGVVHIPIVEPSTQAVKPAFSLHSWQAEGKSLVGMGHALKDSTSMWRLAVGDWFNWGEQHLGEEVYGHVDQIGFSSGALRQYSWVAARVAPELRTLPYSYLRAVAAKEDPEQKRLLGWAVALNLTATDFNRAIQPPKPRLKRWTLEELREWGQQFDKATRTLGHGWSTFLTWLEKEGI